MHYVIQLSRPITYQEQFFEAVGPFKSVMAARIWWIKFEEKIKGLPEYTHMPSASVIAMATPKRGGQ